MAEVSTFSAHQFKSSLWALCASFYQSRENLRDRLKTFRCKHAQLEKHHQRVLNDNRVLKRQLRQAQDELAKHRQEQARQQMQATRQIDEPNVKGHQFGKRMMALACAMANLIGFRSTERVLTLMRQWLQVEFDVPNHDTIRLWNCRNGVAILNENCQQADDWIWLIDHSVQLGKMCVLIVLGIRQSDLPLDRPLRKEDMKPLGVFPTSSRTKEDVGQGLVELAAKTGTPICLVSDGASELHEGAKWLENEGAKVVLMDDVKHKAANLLKKTLGQNERFVQFDREVGKTTARIQQTELDHFLPPAKKTKCRFMNIDKLMDWAEMVRYQLRRPATEGKGNVNPERLQEKLGWLLEYEKDLEQWRECRKVVAAVLKFTNREGVYQGATQKLKQELQSLEVFSPLAQQILKALVDCCSENERKLRDSAYGNLRVPCSTEVLESSLGCFKSLQRHHNRGTFTSLLAVFPTLFESMSANRIAQRMKHTSTKQLHAWLKKAGLTNSTQARKTKAYQESKRYLRQKNNST